MPTAMPSVWRARFDERALVQKQLGSQCDAHASARRAPTETRGLETALSLLLVSCVWLCVYLDRRCDLQTCSVWGLRFDFVCAIHSGNTRITHEITHICVAVALLTVKNP